MCAEREAAEARGQKLKGMVAHFLRLSRTVLPNQSLEARSNGGPPGPDHRYGVHFLWPGPGVPPLAPPHLYVRPHKNLLWRTTRQNSHKANPTFPRLPGYSLTGSFRRQH